MRSPASMQIIQIDITNACPKRCGGCTRMVPHLTKDTTFFMDVPTFERAVESMEGFRGTLGVMGGEPTVHPKFEEISLRFAELWGRQTLAKNGRQPVTDLNAYVTDRLYDHSSKRGLWSSLGAAYYKHYEVIQDVYDHQTINTHDNPGLHQAMLITRKEMGIPDDEWVKLRDACWVQNMWSASINPHGAYFCEVAAALDNHYNGGKNAWPVEKGWWKRTPEEFGSQLSLCELCALALPGPSVVANEDRDVVSPYHRERLLQLGSPAVRRGEVEEWHAGMEQRVVTTCDSYMPSPDMRVPAGHDSLFPRKVSCVTVCVGYAASLEQVIHKNHHQVDELVVVTSAEDVDTQDVVRACEGVTLVVSNAWAEGGASFNKGAMINAGLRVLEKPDWVVLTDADCYLPADLREMTRSTVLNPGVLYGCTRRDQGPGGPGDVAVNKEPNGFFQLFNRRAMAVRGSWPAVMSEKFCSAGSIDSWFQQQFPKDKRVMLPMTVMHIPHGEFGANWNGPPPGRACWRQWGLISDVGIASLDAKPLPPGAKRLRLTDTLRSRSAELDMADGQTHLPDDVVHWTPTMELVFLGENIGSHHVHVAVWEEPPCEAPVPCAEAAGTTTSGSGPG